MDFSPDSELPVELRPQIIERVKEASFSSSIETSANWVNDLAELIREPSQNAGYFKAVVDVNTGLVKAEALRLHYWASIDVKTGAQYRLGSVRFKTAPQFPESVLREAIPLNDGDIFDVSKIRAGLDGIRRLYASLGYIYAIVEPQTTVADAANRIDINFNVEPGAQYRIARVDLLGFEPATANLVRSKLAPGEVFDGRVLDEFLSANQHLRYEGVTIRRDINAHLVSISINARCRLDAPQEAQPASN